MLLVLVASTSCWKSKEITEVQVSLYASGTREHIPDVDPPSSKNHNSKPTFVIGLTGTSPRLMTESSPVLVPDKYGDSALSLCATNAALEMPMVLRLGDRPKDSKRELGANKTVSIKLDIEEALTLENGYLWQPIRGVHSGAISPAFTRSGEVAESITAWLELQTADKFYRSEPIAFSTKNLEEKLAEFSKSVPFVVPKTNEFPR